MNTGKISNPAVAFGGVKESGIGREVWKGLSVHSIDVRSANANTQGSSLGIHEYLEVKSITTDISL